MTTMLTIGEQQELRQIEQDCEMSAAGSPCGWPCSRGAPGAMLMEPNAFMALGDGAWLGWAFGPEPDHDASAAQDRTSADGTDLT